MADISVSSQDVELVDQSSGIRANVVSTASGGVQLVQHPTPLPSGTNWLGLVSIAQPINSVVSLSASAAHIGSVSIFGTVQSSSGNVTLNPGPNSIGSVTLNNSNANIGSVSILGGTLNANVSLFASSAKIGIVTSYPGRSLTTSLATVYSAVGNHTLFVPPASQRWYLHSLFVNVQGNTDGNIKSGTKPMFPMVGLSTLSGLTHTIPDPGLPATAVNEAFVVAINSAATLGITGTFHFE